MSEWKLWGRFGSSHQRGSPRPPKLYFIPWQENISNHNRTALSLGHQNQNERDFEGFVRALNRASSADADGVVFPSSFLMAPFYAEVIRQAKTRKLRLVFELALEAPDVVETQKGPEGAEDRLFARLSEGDAVTVAFGAGATPSSEIVRRLEGWPEQVYFTYCVRADDDAAEIVLGLPEFIKERLFFQFPYHVEIGDGFLNCSEVFKTINKIKFKSPHLQVKPRLGVENFDPRISPELVLEPLCPVLVQTQFGLGHSAGPEVSVIVPSYNNREYLINTLLHLSRQDFPKEKYEIIVVDDGSSDGTGEEIKKLSEDFVGGLNLKYIYSPRPSQRQMGDSSYRAGISRNLGVKAAQGNILVFLDSDILTPTHFISDLYEKHQHFDVIQCQRMNLKKDLSNRSIKYEEIRPKLDTFATEGGYWERFNSAKDWPELPFFWKYTCTYGLSLSKSLFKQVGGLKRGFVFYGFEDVDLGYRLALAGARFHLNNICTYHLFHHDSRSEYQNSDLARQELLSKTAQIFYLNTLDPQIYTHFRGLMGERSVLPPKFDRKPTAPRAAQIFGSAALVLNHWRWLIWRLLGLVRSHTWRIRVLGQRARGRLGTCFFKSSYPIRKIVYFSAYQWNTRVRQKASVERRQLEG